MRGGEAACFQEWKRAFCPVWKTGDMKGKILKAWHWVVSVLLFSIIGSNVWKTFLQVEIVYFFKWDANLRALCSATLRAGIGLCCALALMKAIPHNSQAVGQRVICFTPCTCGWGKNALEAPARGNKIFHQHSNNSWDSSGPIYETQSQKKGNNVESFNWPLSPAL